MSLRLGELLPDKRRLWQGRDALASGWRLSVEDPFEAYDSDVSFF